MRLTWPAFALLLVAFCGGCGSDIELPDPPAPPRPLFVPAHDGFPVHPQSACSRAVRNAVDNHDWPVLSRLVARGDTVRCLVPPGSSPLDVAIENDDAVGVRTVLEAGADPNLRSSSHGDRLPVQGAVEAQMYSRPQTNRAEIVRLLLRHGADANARWCPFETRSSDPAVLSCFSASGGTPLHVAALLDQADVTYRLLDAGADVTAEDWMGWAPAERAGGRAVFEFLLAAQFPDPTTRNSWALRYFSTRYPTGNLRGPWDETPLARALVMPSGERGQPGRAALLLELGTDPNQRLTWGEVDWPPLALAVMPFWPNRDFTEVLLAHGADPNVRWCVRVVRSRPASGYRPEPGCQLAKGMTPLMAAAQRGNAGAIVTLVRHGADTNLTDWKGRTAVDYAPPNRREDIRSALGGR